MSDVISSKGQLPNGFSLESIPPMPLPTSVLMCQPDYFQVVDVKNPFMKGQEGQVDRRDAATQWRALKETFERIGLTVEEIAPEPDLEDMVFCANQVFIGLDSKGHKVCIPSHMRYPSRQREVPAFKRWFSTHGYEIEPLGDPALSFEGGGDGLWHPGRRLIWGGVGPRTHRSIYAPLAKRFEAPVLCLDLVSDSFYHLDTCLSLVDKTTALIHSPAFSSESLALIQAVIPRLIEVGEGEAKQTMACNAAAFGGMHVVLQKGAERTVEALTKMGLKVVEVETSQFMKSGGSVFCMKMALY